MQFYSDIFLENGQLVHRHGNQMSYENSAQHNTYDGNSNGQGVEYTEDWTQPQDASASRFDYRGNGSEYNFKKQWLQEKEYLVQQKFNKTQNQFSYQDRVQHTNNDTGWADEGREDWTQPKDDCSNFGKWNGSSYKEASVNKPGWKGEPKHEQTTYKPWLKGERKHELNERTNYGRGVNDGDFKSRGHNNFRKGNRGAVGVKNYTPHYERNADNFGHQNHGNRRPESKENFRSEKWNGSTSRYNKVGHFECGKSNEFGGNKWSSDNNGSKSDKIKLGEKQGQLNTERQGKRGRFSEKNWIPRFRGKQGKFGFNPYEKKDSGFRGNFHGRSNNHCQGLTGTENWETWEPNNDPKNAEWKPEETWEPIDPKSAETRDMVNESWQNHRQMQDRDGSTDNWEIWEPIDTKTPESNERGFDESSKNHCQTQETWETREPVDPKIPELKSKEEHVPKQSSDLQIESPKKQFQRKKRINLPESLDKSKVPEVPVEQVDQATSNQKRGKALINMAKNWKERKQLPKKCSNISQETQTGQPPSNVEIAAPQISNMEDFPPLKSVPNVSKTSFNLSAKEISDIRQTLLGQGGHRKSRQTVRSRRNSIDCKDAGTQVNATLEPSQEKTVSASKKKSKRKSKSPEKKLYVPPPRRCSIDSKKDACIMTEPTPETMFQRFVLEEGGSWEELPSKENLENKIKEFWKEDLDKLDEAKRQVVTKMAGLVLMNTLTNKRAGLKDLHLSLKTILDPAELLKPTEIPKKTVIAKLPEILLDDKHILPNKESIKSPKKRLTPTIMRNNSKMFNRYPVKLDPPREASVLPGKIVVTNIEYAKSCINVSTGGAGFRGSYRNVANPIQIDLLRSKHSLSSVVPDWFEKKKVPKPLEPTAAQPDNVDWESFYSPVGPVPDIKLCEKKYMPVPRNDTEEHLRTNEFILYDDFGRVIKVKYPSIPNRHGYYIPENKFGFSDGLYNKRPKRKYGYEFTRYILPYDPPTFDTTSKVISPLEQHFVNMRWVCLDPEALKNDPCYKSCLLNAESNDYKDLCDCKISRRKIRN